MIALLLLILLPLIEIAVFVEAGAALGLWPTLGLTVVSALVGAAAMRAQGLGALRQAKTEIEAGRDPGAALLSGALVLAGGCLLLIPGFVTDAAGILLLLPPVRAALIARAGRRIAMTAARPGRTGRTGPAGPAPSGPPTIEVDYEEAPGPEAKR